MAKVESEYINVNRLYGKPVGSSQVRAAKGLYAIQNGVPVKKYRMFNGNILTFDAWDTILESPDEFEIPAKGGNLQEFMDITSHYTRGANEIESIPFSINPQSVVANNTTNVVEHNVTITQDETNATITVKGMQKANEQAIEWGEITIKNVYVYNNEYISAVGGINHPVYICALISQVKTSVNSSTGLPVTENVDQEVDLLSVKGSVLVSGTSVSGNMIYAPNRGTDNKGNRSVYTVTGGVVEMNGVTKEFSLNINQQFDVMQSQNYGQVVGTPTFTLNVNGISNNQSFDATQINEVVEIVSTQKQEYSWPSGVPNTFVESPCECRISFSRTGCTADPSSGSGEWVSTIKIPANTGSSAISTTITFNNGTTVTRKVSQSANTADKVIWGKPTITGVYDKDIIPVTGGTAYLYVYYSQTKTTYYSNGTNDGGQTQTNLTGMATILNGSGLNGSYIDGDGVYMKSAGTTEYDTDRVAYTISKYEITANGKTSDPVTNNVSIYQEANPLMNDGKPTYTFKLYEENNVELSASEQDYTISFDSYTIQKRKYAAGIAGPDLKTNQFCTASITSGSLYASVNPLTSKESFIVSFDVNIGNERSATLNIADYSGSNHTITFTQISNSVDKVIWGKPTITGVYDKDIIPVTGGTAYLYVYYSQTKTTYYSNGTNDGGQTQTKLTGMATILNGSGLNGSYIDGDGVYMKSAGTTGYDTDRVAYTIKKYQLTAHEKTSDPVTNNVSIYQEANPISNYGSPTYTFSLSDSSNVGIEAPADKYEIYFSSYTTQKRKYATGLDADSITTNQICSASISSGSSYAYLSGSTTSSNMFTVNFYANTGSSSRTIKVNINDYNGVSHTITFTQTANSSTTTLTNVTVEEIAWDVNGETSGGYIEASGGSATVSVYLKKTYTTVSTATGSSDSYKYVWADSVSIKGSGTASKTGDTITISNLKDSTTNSATTVYTVTKVTWSYKDENGKSWGTTTNHSKSIIQEANQINYGTWSYSISATTASTSYTAAATPVTATVTSKRTRSYTYTSNYNDSNGNVQTENCGWTASITSATGNSVSPTSASAGTSTAQISLGANTSTSSSKTTKVTFTNASSTSKTTTITYTQSKDALSTPSVTYTKNTPTVTQPSATGGTATISFTLKKTTTPVYVSGNTGAASSKNVSVTVASINGSAVNNSGAYISGTGVYVKNAGTLDKPNAWNVFNITSVSGTYNGTTYTWSGTLYVKQGPNTKSKDGSLTYTFTVSGGGTGITAASQQEVISVVSTSTQKYKWTSGSPADSVVSNVSCSVSTNRGTLSSSSVSGNSSVTITLPENTSKSSTQTTTVTFNNGQTSKSVSFVQNADALISESITRVSPTSVVAEEVDASGSTNVSITFNCSVTTTKKYYTTANTTSSTATKAATITGITGSAPTSGVGVGLISNKTTYLTCGSLAKNTTTAATTVYTITKVTGKISGWANTITWTGSSVVKIGINSSSTSYGAYSVSLSANPTTGIANTGGASTLTGTCKRAYTNTWTSGASESGYNNAAATITVNKGSLSTSSITGSGTSTWSIPVNATASAQTWTATIKCTNDTSKTKTATVSQNASTYVLEEQQNDIISQAGGSFNVYVKSTRNGSAFALSKSNVSISGVTGTVNTVTTDTTHGAGGYKINITGVPANKTSSNKTMNVKVTQPESGKSITIQCIQAGITKTSKDVKWLGTFSFAPSLGGSGVNYSRISVSDPIFSAVDDDKYTYTGGTLSNVTFTVVGQNGNNISTKNIGTITVSAGSTANISSYLPASGLTGSTSNIPMYVKVSWTSSKGNTTEQHGIEDNGYMDQ